MKKRFEWHEHICEYFNVSQEEALKLGSRSDGRKPNLPGNESCVAVSNKTYEDIWSLSDRKTNEEIFQFYKDQGSWSTFRQCVRHSEMENFHVGMFNLLLKNNFLKSGGHFCEYGCGVAPFSTSFLNYVEDTSIDLEFTLCDVDSNHFDFAKHRLNKIKKDYGFNNLKLNFIEVKPNNLPAFTRDIDLIFCFEVMEHVPSPILAMKNIKESMNPGSVYVENFIKHQQDEKDEDGPDLKSAREERDQYYSFLNDYYNMLYPSRAESEKNPNVTRVWQRNSL